ncbi:DUF488 domain-containing protein [Gracilimonas sp. BCB1]|uniref:DUF488 domain-containing protein n=1 Tax=Gracilimonas sp. BCB1 TaxID=3152362 RepID=UPI0032D8DB92
MKESTIYSIGHGNKEIDDFINELKSYGILYLLDVRSKPYSSRNIMYNREAIKRALKMEGITYAFFGDKLGGLPKDRSCYDEEGKVRYDLIKEKGFFKEGMQRLLNAQKKGIKVAVMCSESKPEQCHRSKLIGQELLKKEISMKHIVSDSVIKSQETVMSELTKGKSTSDLFGIEINLTSKKSY